MAHAEGPAPGPFDAVVLAGGTGRRLGGADKPSLEVGGVPLLDRVLAAVAHADRTVVVGPKRPVARPVVWTREDPPGTGPAAALLAGLRLAEGPTVMVVASDLPFLDRAAVDALRRAAAGRDGAVLVDDEGREQWLVGAWSAAALRRAAAGAGSGGSVRRLVGGLDRAAVALPPGEAATWRDCDTTDDLAWARRHAVGPA